MQLSHAISKAHGEGDGSLRQSLENRKLSNLMLPLGHNKCNSDFQFLLAHLLPVRDEKAEQDIIITLIR